MTEVTKPTLIYFNTVGRAEVARILLELAGINYHWHAIAWNNSPGESWEEYKKKHGDELVFGQLPQYKEPGGVNIVQSGSIVRHIAREYGFNGTNQREAVAIDVLFEGASELSVGYYRANHTEESRRAEEINKYLTDFAPKHLAHFQRALERNNDGNGFFVGNKISYADVSTFLILRHLWSNVAGGKEIIEKFPTLTAFLERIGEIPNIRKYFASEPYKSNPKE